MNSKISNFYKIKLIEYLENKILILADKFLSGGHKIE
jgi:hypothetical protein